MTANHSCICLLNLSGYRPHSAHVFPPPSSFLRVMTLATGKTHKLFIFKFVRRGKVSGENWICHRHLLRNVLRSSGSGRRWRRRASDTRYYYILVAMETKAAGFRAESRLGGAFYLFSRANTWQMKGYFLFYVKVDKSGVSSWRLFLHIR